MPVKPTRQPQCLQRRPARPMPMFCLLTASALRPRRASQNPKPMTTMASAARGPAVRNYFGEITSVIQHAKHGIF